MNYLAEIALGVGIEIESLCPRHTIELEERGCPWPLVEVLRGSKGIAFLFEPSHIRPLIVVSSKSGYGSIPGGFQYGDPGLVDQIASYVKKYADPYGELG